MWRPIFVVLFGLVLVQAAAAGGIDPDKAGDEARDSLKELLAKQRQDRDAREAQPDPPKPRPKTPERPPGASGSDLPAVCIGCGGR